MGAVKPKREFVNMYTRVLIGHLNIGNKGKIGGGSGVVKNIPDNTKVMGYPAKNIREFLRDNK